MTSQFSAVGKDPVRHDGAARLPNAVIEDLGIGDLVITASGAARRIKAPHETTSWEPPEHSDCAQAGEA